MEKKSKLGTFNNVAEQLTYKYKCLKGICKKLRDTNTGKLKHGKKNPKVKILVKQMRADENPINQKAHSLNTDDKTGKCPKRLCP